MISKMLVAVLCALMPRISMAQSGSPCAAPAEDWGFVSFVQRIASDTASDYAQMRGDIGVSLMPPDSALLVQDESVCRLAAEAYTKAVNDTTRSAKTRRVHVVRLGSRFLVQDPYTAARAGEFETWLVFDEHWRVIIGYDS